MIVELAQTWFAPTPKVTVNKGREISGRRYRAGQHELPDNMYSILPTSAKIIEPPSKFVKDDEPWVAKRKWDLDKDIATTLEARSMEQYQAVHDEAEKTRKEIQMKRMAKVRAAKAEKKAKVELAENAVEEN